MKFKEIKDVPVKELELKLRQNRVEQMHLRTKKSAGQLEKPHTLKLLRKDAARILTALTAKRAAAAKTETKAPVAKKVVKAHHVPHKTPKKTPAEKAEKKAAVKTKEPKISKKKATK